MHSIQSGAVAKTDDENEDDEDEEENEEGASAEDEDETSEDAAKANKQLRAASGRHINCVALCAGGRWLERERERGKRERGSCKRFWCLTYDVH